MVDRLLEQGVATIVYTDVARDGAMTGPTVDTYRKLLPRMKKSNCALIASGGVGSVEDLLALKKLEQLGLVGVVVGRALYEGTVDLKVALTLC